MNKIKYLLTISLASGLFAGSVQAANVLYWSDSFIGTDYWSPAFALRGDTVTTATGASDLVTQLGAGTWDVVVISENDNNASTTWAAPIANYIAGGGKVVLNNWYSEATVDAATQVTTGSPINQTSATINAQGIAAGLAAGVPTNPFTLGNTGWGTFSHPLSPVGDAQSLCDFPTGSCAVLGNSGRTVRLGFIPDTLPASVGAQLLANALAIAEAGAAPAPVPVTPTPVPTLSEWAMAIMAGLMAAIAFVTLRRRRA